MSRDVVKLTSKGQLTLPKKIRNQLQLEKGAELAVEMRGEQVILEKVKPSSALGEEDPIWDMVGIFYSRGENGDGDPGRGARAWKKKFW